MFQQTGDDTIALPAGVVTRYFICGVQGHCNSGKKLVVKVDHGRRFGSCSRGHILEEGKISANYLLFYR
jgi:hypothetical protein